MGEFGDQDIVFEDISKNDSNNLCNGFSNVDKINKIIKTYLNKVVHFIDIDEKAVVIGYEVSSFGNIILNLRSISVYPESERNRYNFYGSESSKHFKKEFDESNISEVEEIRWEDY